MTGYRYTSLQRLQAREAEIAAIRAAALEEGIGRFPPGPMAGTPHSRPLTPDRYTWPDPHAATFGAQLRLLRSLW